MKWRIDAQLGLGALLASIVVVATIPVAVECANSAFGLGSFLLVPTLGLALLFTTLARSPNYRVWWFALSCTTAAWLLLLSSVAETAILDVAEFLQDLTQRGTIALSQRVIEPTAVVSILFVPVFGAIASGAVVARMWQRWFNGENTSELNAGRWRLSTRELFVGMAAVCTCLAIGMHRIGTRRADAVQSEGIFLSRFERSFTSGNIRLQGPARIVGIRRTLVPESGYRSFMPPDINEYRVISRITKDESELWAVWTYTCNGEHKDLIYQFGYAEASAENKLPPSPYPMKAHVNATWGMVDGMPK